MTEGQKTNKPLFSQHYLEHRLQDCPEWQIDVTEGFKQLKNLYQSKQDLLPTLSEAQTEDLLIQPILEILGLSYIPQVTIRAKGRAERPDYALFNNEIERDQAYPLQTDETAFYSRVIAIAEAKYWQRPLSKVSTNDQRDIYKNTNPSFQIANYLMGTGVDWGILTNGREWRLYYRQASSKATEFYQVDLLELLSAENLDQFKYFWLFFRQEAFVKDPQGRNFLERVREGSTTYSTRVGNELKALVFDRIFPNLAGGFVADATQRGQPVTSEQVYEATLSFLYKLLFLLYAEARNLLPIQGDYRDYSLIQLTQEVAENLDRQKKLSQTSTGMYDKLLNLFKIFDRGDRGLEVPRYNGGLFHFNFSQTEDQLDYSANYFLSQFKLSDAVLAPVLDLLARFEGQPIDYSFLGVRQLGSIYEGLLEYRVIIKDALTGNIYLENDKGDRKATGSYYTPDYIVKYIVSHTLKPILEQRSQRFAELMTQIQQLQNQLQDQRLGQQSLNGLKKDLKRLQRDAQTTLLDIKIFDPAMGSGHFLVEAVDYLTDELIHILSQYPEQNPVLEMLDQTRQSILSNLEQQGITINPDRLEPTQLLQRVVMKRCIYGVDLNPMAVELAKVSLWLHSFTIGAPLSFLDHHLRCGNSLIGITAREAEAKMAANETGQLSLLTGPFVELLKAAEIMRGVSVLSDATFAEVEQSEKLFRSFDQAAKPYKRLLDIYVSQFFGIKQAQNFLERFGTHAITANPNQMNKADAAIYEEAQKLSDEKRFFHWDLEFPEVFIDLENANWKENSGFDAVVGNPPYDILAEKERKENLGYFINYLKSNPVFAPSLGGKLDLFRLFICRSDYLISPVGFVGLIIPMSLLADQQAISLRKFLLQENKICQVNAFPQKDDPNLRIFKEAKLPTCIIILNRSVSNKPIEVTVHPGNLLEEISGNFSCSLTEIEALDDDNLPIPLLSSNQEVNVLKRFNSPNKIQKINNIFLTYQGEINETTMDHLISTNLNSGSRILRGGNVQRYEFIPEPKQGMAKYLNVTEYYQQIGGERTAHTLQPRIGYQRNAALDSWKRLIFAPLPTPCYCFDSVSYFLVENHNFSLALLALLNSRLLEWRFRLTSTNNHVSTSEIAALPIPKFTFTTPTDRRQKSLENVIALYNQYQTNGNSEPILSQIDDHLNQQPEEADIIHDLLAYLAEQMIELNKQKQAEIQSFLQWLECFLGCPIDSLTNKSKIQNYLGDYYKNEPHISFDELISVLNKNKKKIKIDPVNRKEQQTLKKEYQNSLNTLLPLKNQLIRCDQLIDATVYKLYGLTEEEIAIVEGR
ncbi:putative adenine-specific methylase MJECS02 [Planktothrix tepida]|uniref:site-specific DNA-methyltransferase (adenine-specific) n=1 Tax=Planktothrix tepida PCC 9214 TaxID=671072 RepID=A0A1J1LT71_9CYAN|nr:putative adenine-specific methylase MJECS02 [Planktothrix tepida]CUR35781.1 Genome sequencing data, contig C321 [Planktothrix tepida PCC 9214]